MTFLATLRRLGARVDALNLRERVLLLLGSVAVLFVSIDGLGLEPVYRQKRALTLDIEARTVQLERLRQLSARADIAADGEPENPRDELQRDLDVLARQLDVRLERLLSPHRASDILEQVLAHDSGLRLNAIDTRLTPLDSIEGDRESAAPVGRLNRYELDVELEGGYMDTLDYLRALDSLRWKFFWSGIDFKVADFPRARVGLQIYTLGRTGG